MFTTSNFQKIPTQTKAAAVIAFLPLILTTTLHATTGDSSSFLGSGLNILMEVYSYFKIAIYIGAAIGLIIMAALAFVGRFGWTRFLSICGGVFIVAMADELFTLLTNGTAGGTALSGAGLM